MSMHGRGGPMRAMHTDAQAQRAKNADAPDIPNLFPRIAKLFVNYKPQLALVVILVLIASALTVIPRCSFSSCSIRGSSRSPVASTSRSWGNSSQP